MQPWARVVFALADVFIQMNRKSSFSLGLLLFSPSLLTLPRKMTSSFSGTVIFFN